MYSSFKISTCFFSLFVLVAMSVSPLSLLATQIQQKNQEKNSVTKSPPPSSNKTCLMSGKSYRLGEAVKHEDGCNTCVCSKNPKGIAEMQCTLMLCVDTSDTPSKLKSDPFH